VAAFASALVLLTACPGGAGLPAVPGGGGGGGGKVDPNSCGNYAVSDAGRKLRAFLEATVELNDTVTQTVSVVKESCRIMGEELGMAPGELEGETKAVCDKVIAQLKNDLKVGLKAEAALKVDYKPAVCKVNVDAAAKAAAECEAKAEGEVSVQCEGTCSGTCNGECAGKCAGSSGSGGACKGRCEGTCKGNCSGGCEGAADVKASAQCEAKAEVHASVTAECTEPELKVTVDAKMIVDKTRAEAAINAIKKGMPKMLSVKARLRPLGVATRTWINAAQELSRAGRDLTSSFKDQALCITGQISAAVGMIANIEASVSVSVEVSASASGTIGG